MKKILLLVCMVVMPLYSIDFNNYSAVPDRVNVMCNEVFGYCHVSCLTDRTFFWSRPVYRNIGAQKPLWQEFVFNTCQSLALQIIPIYQQSAHDRDLAHYFLFNDQHNLLIKGDAVVANNPYSRDVRAEWLGLPSNFAGTFSVHPRQKQFGLWIEAMMPLGNCFGYECLDSFWVGVALPYQMIENKVTPTQTPPINPGTTFPTDALEALSNPAYLFQKFDGKKKKNGLAEVDFKLGTNLLNRDYFQIGMYSMLVIPLRGSANQEFVFNPFLGNNGHFGFGSGVTFKLPLLCDPECQLFSFFAYFENIYFFRNHQKRTFDLIDRPWSRYLLLNNKEGGLNIPAMNILTRRVRARPYNMLDLYTGFDWELSNVQVEVGYGLWARGREQLKFADCFPADFGIAGVGFLSTTSAIPATASRSTIQEQAPNDVNFRGEQIFVPIRVEDLDIDSGAARGALAHRGHISVGYIYATESFAVLAGVGAFIEASQYSSALSNWGVWGKVGISY